MGFIVGSVNVFRIDIQKGYHLLRHAIEKNQVYVAIMVKIHGVVFRRIESANPG
jgi:hypothetical protein